MRKVGLITLWKGNYGSQLQCFATQHLFAREGFECVLIERKDTGLFSYLLHGVMNRLYRGWIMLRFHNEREKIQKLVREGRRQARAILPAQTKRFIEAELQPHFDSYRALRRLAKSPAYCFFLCGSDQVWNGACADFFMPGFLTFAPKGKRVAFAPSFGGENVPEYNRTRFRNALRSFQFLSARERSAAEWIQNLTGKPCVQVLDPVLQLTTVEWETILHKRNLSAFEGSAYVVAYFLDEPPTEAECFLRRFKEVRIISLPEMRETLSKQVEGFSGDPLALVALFRKAQYIVTDSFHATAFALMFHRPFMTFPRQYRHGYPQSERILSLLTLCGLTDRFATGTVDDKAEKCIDYDKVDRRLTKEREVSQAYIQQISNFYRE